MNLTKKLIALATSAIVGVPLIAVSLQAAADPLYTSYTIPTSNIFLGQTTLGPDGNMWFLEDSANKVGKITSTGTISEYNITTASSGADGIVAGPDGNLWFTEFSANQIGVISTNGTMLHEYAASGCINPYHITKGPDGNLWFTGNGNNTICKMTTAGVTTAYTIPTGVSPLGIVVGPDGNLWFTAAGNGKVGSISTSGTFGAEYSMPDGAGSYPTSITTGPDNNLWITNSDITSIVKMTTAGSMTEYPIATRSGNSNPMNIVSGPDGNLWFVEDYATNLARITTSGTITEFALPSPLTSPVSDSFDSAGNLWILSAGSAVNAMTKAVIPRTPGLVNQTASVVSGQSTTVQVLSGASNDPGASTVTIVSGPSHGSATVNSTNGSITYTPKAGYTGADSLTFQACSALDSTVCSQGTLTFNVTAAAPNTGFGSPTSANSSVMLAAVSLLLGVLALGFGYRKYHKLGSAKK